MNTNIEYVRKLAKEKAELTKQNQVIYATYYKQHRIFRFKPETEWTGAIVEVVRYTPKNKRRNVLQDNGNRGFRVADKQEKPELQSVEVADKPVAAKTKKRTTRKTKRKTK